MGNGNDDPRNPEVMRPGPGTPAEEAVLNGQTVMRVEHDAMLAVSIQRKRNEDEVLAEALAELERAPMQAATNYYVIEYASGDRIEGGSVNLARSLARRWGNCSVRSYIVSEDDERVHLAGVFLDLQTNFRVETPWVVSKTVWRRKGGLQKDRDDQLLVRIQAGAAKAMRNAIFDGLPKYLIASVNEKAREIAAKVAGEGAKNGKLLERFLLYGVTREMIERRFGGTALENFTAEQLADLMAIGNKLRDKEAGVADEFEKPPRSAEEVDAMEAGDGGALTADEIAAQLGKTSVTGGSEGQASASQPPSEPAAAQASEPEPASPSPPEEEPPPAGGPPAQGSLGKGWL